MNFLHIFSMAGTAEIFGYYARKLGHYSLVLQLRSLDPFGFGDHYGNTLYFDNYDKLLEAADTLRNESDVIILHDFIEFTPEFDDNNLMYYFHGSKLRDILSKQPDSMEEIRNHKTFLSTSDLLTIIPDGIHINQPIDLELFKKINDKPRNGQLCINREYQRDQIEPKILKRYPDCVYRSRNTNTIIPYSKMPEFLNEWESYVDWKFDYSKPPKTLHVPSMTGLQALACGCKVSGPSGAYNEKLLLKHDAVKVTREFLSHASKPRSIKGTTSVH